MNLLRTFFKTNMNKLQTIKFSCKLIPCFALIKLIQNVPPSPPLVPLLHFIVLHPYPLSHHTNAPFKTLTIGPDSCAVVKRTASTKLLYLDRWYDSVGTRVLNVSSIMCYFLINFSVIYIWIGPPFYQNVRRCWFIIRISTNFI
jgi:hypothetical protein